MIGILLIVYIIFCAGAIFSGYYLRFVASKDEEMKYGFRTSQTQKSADAWEYANRTLGLHWLRCGVIGLVLGIPAVLLMYKYKGVTASNILSLVCLVFFVIVVSSSVTSVMKATYSKFDEDGRPVDKDKL